MREALKREVQEHDATLLVLDGVMTLNDPHGDERELRQLLYDTSGMLSALGCTLLITSSRSDLDDPNYGTELTMADALIRLTQTVAGTRSDRHLQRSRSAGERP